MLKVVIRSFSYRKGYPGDNTGQGGGFVFDCRALDVFDYNIFDNPEALKVHFNRTGKDAEVVRALDQNVAAQKFFEAIWSLIEIDIQKCLRRGFKNMTVNFGCTAGRHRSVYFAERMAKVIKDKFPEVEIDLDHLEKDHWPVQGA